MIQMALSIFFYVLIMMVLKMCSDFSKLSFYSGVKRKKILCGEQMVSQTKFLLLFKIPD